MAKSLFGRFIELMYLFPVDPLGPSLLSPCGGCYVCREGQLTHFFFPGRVGRGYGSDWTLAVVVVVSPALSGWNV